VSSWNLATSFCIRPAVERDWRALRILLPQAIYFGCRCRLGAAVADSRIIGAVALDPVVRSAPHPGQRIALHVIEPWRRRGVGRALLGWADEIVRQNGSAALYAWSSVEPDGAAAIAWRRLGFEHSQPHPQTSVDCEKTIAYLKAAEQRLLGRSLPPPSVKVVPIQKITPLQRQQAIALHMAHLGGPRATVESQLQEDSPAACDDDLSHVLLLEDRAVGLALVRRASPTACLIESDVLDPKIRRGGWANLLLKLVPALACEAAGMRTFVFDTFQQHGDSRRFAEKVGGFTVDRIEPYRLIPAARSA
jgi:GNAT superfamily N-acetyltransferase